MRKRGMETNNFYKIIKTKDLSSPEQNTLKASKRIARKVVTTGNYQIKVFEIMTNDPELKNCVYGNCDENLIRINRQVLQSLPWAMGTLLHELAHWESDNANDCSSKFEDQLTAYLGILGEYIISGPGIKKW